jgi:hypothetical protein
VKKKEDCVVDWLVSLTERAEVFKSLLWEGHYTYIYTCRATSAGSFVVPPAKAEEMYFFLVFSFLNTN